MVQTLVAALGSDKMAQQVKTYASKYEDLSLIPGPQDRKEQSLETVL